MKTNAIRLERIKRRIGARWLEQTRAEVGQAVGSAVIGFLLGAGSMFGAIAPFPVAAVAALPLNCILPGTVGNLLGCLLFTRTQRSFPLIIAGIVIVLLRLLAARVIRGRIKPVFLSLLAFGVMALASVFYSMVANVS